MSSEVAQVAAERSRPAWLRILRGAENWLLAAVLLALAGLPIAEIVAREALGTSVPNSSWWVQHLTLVVGTLGSLVAAREGRMLAMSAAPNLLRGRALQIAIVIGNGLGAAIAFWLGVAGLWWLHSEHFPELPADAGLTRTLGEIASALGKKPIQALLPLGFFGIGLRLVAGAQGGLGKAATFLLALVASLVAWKLGTPRETLSWWFLGALLFATLLGTPLFATLGGAALILYWRDDVPTTTVAISHYTLATNAMLPAIPLFTLAGYFLAEGGSAPRVVRLCQALVGSVRGGPAMVTALACAFFTTFTGASGVTIIVVGGLMMPVLLHAGFSERRALGFLTGAGSLGMLFPPCLPLILYAVKAELEPKQLFLAGLVPGALLVALTMAWGWKIAPKGSGAGVRFSGRELLAACWAAKWELLVPVVAIGAYYSGLMTLLESAAATALYALFVVMVVHRDLHPLRDLPRVLGDAGLMAGGVLLILGVAIGFTAWLFDAEAAAFAVDWVKANVESRFTFLLALNLLMLVVGCLMDVFTAIIVVVPLILPMGKLFGIDPLHLGIVVLANLELGYLTPPIGLNLFLASYRFQKPLPEVYRAALPMILVLAFGVLVITYVPALTTLLPSWFGK